MCTIQTTFSHCTDLVCTTRTIFIMYEVTAQAFDDTTAQPAAIDLCALENALFGFMEGEWVLVLPSFIAFCVSCDFVDVSSKCVNVGHGEGLICISSKVLGFSWC